MDIQSIYSTIINLKNSYRDSVLSYREIKYVGLYGDSATDPMDILDDLDDADVIVAFIHYSYSVQTNTDIDYLIAFFSKEAKCDSKISIDGWTLSFDTQHFNNANHTYNKSVIITNDFLRLNLTMYPHLIPQDFDRIWKLFILCQSCKTQLELDYLRKLYYQKTEILELKKESFRIKAENDQYKCLLNSYRELLNKIEGLLDK